MTQTTEKRKATGADVFRWFVSGANEVYSHVKHLNLINVFPVADGDTGSNMAATLRAMVANSTPVQSFHNMLKTVIPIRFGGGARQLGYHLCLLYQRVGAGKRAVSNGDNSAVFPASRKKRSSTCTPLWKIRRKAR